MNLPGWSHSELVSLKVHMQECRKDSIEASSCSGKEKFKSKTVAEKVRKLMARRNTSAGSIACVCFKCSTCGEWHIGSRGGKGKERRPPTRRKHK